MNYKGKLIRWNEDRGFGFITSDISKQDIFIHISALKKMSRNPLVGDLIYFELLTDKDGKKRAEKARIEGVSIIDNGNVSSSRSSSNKIYVFAFIVFVIACSYFFKLFFAGSSSSQLMNNKINNVSKLNSFSCQGKQFCSEMSSCEEAIFYLNNCPNVKIDGNNDGTPCEIQWCK